MRKLFDAHYQSVWRLLRRLGVDINQVDDAAQEVFWVAARRLNDIASGRESAFLYGVALRVAMSEQRRAQSRPQLSAADAMDRLVDEAPTPERQAEHLEARALLDRLLAQMPDDLRTVFVLSELESNQCGDAPLCTAAQPCGAGVCSIGCCVTPQVAAQQAALARAHLVACASDGDCGINTHCDEGCCIDNVPN